MKFFGGQLKRFFRLIYSYQCTAQLLLSSLRIAYIAELFAWYFHVVTLFLKVYFTNLDECFALLGERSTQVPAVVVKAHCLVLINDLGNFNSTAGLFLP